MRQTTDLTTILDAKAAIGSGKVFNVSDYKFITIMLGTAGSANLTVKCQGSIGDDAPDFSAPQSVSNHWDYIDVTDLQDGSSIDGDTGIAPAGTDDFRLLEINASNLKWINFTVTAYTAGSITVKARGASD